MTNEESRTNTEVIKNTYYSKITLVTQISGLKKKLNMTQSPNGCRGFNYLSVAQS